MKVNLRPLLLCVVLISWKTEACSPAAFREMIVKNSHNPSPEKRFTAASSSAEAWRILSPNKARTIAEELLADRDEKIVAEMVASIKAIAPSVDEAAAFLTFARPLKDRLRALSTNGKSADLREFCLRDA